MAADIVEFAEGLKDVFIASFAAGTPITASIQRVWKREFDLGTFNEMRVDVWTFPYRNAGDVDRETFDLEETVAIVFAERYKQTGEVPTAWIDERVQIMRDRIFGAIEGIPQLALAGFRFKDNRVTTVCDHEYIREHKVFWSELMLTVRKLVDQTN